MYSNVPTLLEDMVRALDSCGDLSNAHIRRRAYARAGIEVSTKSALDEDDYSRLDNSAASIEMQRRLNGEHRYDLTPLG